MPAMRIGNPCGLRRGHRRYTEFQQDEFTRDDLVRDSRLGQRARMRRVAIIQEGDIEERARKDRTHDFLGSHRVGEPLDDAGQRDD